MSETTTAHDFQEVIQTKVGDRTPLIVGGHAVNIWAMYYERRIGEELAPFRPFTSKDLDIYGTRALLDALHDKLGGTKHLSPPRTPVIGKIEIQLEGRLRSVDVLHAVRGLTAKDMEVVVPVKIEGLTALVLAPAKLLKAKIENVVTLEQTNRNDLKHLQMMIFCQREFIIDFLNAAEAKEIEPRAVVNLLEETRAIIDSADAMKAESLGAVVYADVWPIAQLRKSSFEKIRNFVSYRLP